GLEAAGDLLADDTSHAAAHEPEVEDRDRDPDALDLADPPHEGVAQPGLQPCRLQPVRIRTVVVEAEPVDGLDSRVALLEAVRVEEHVDPLADRHPEVVAARRAEAQGPLELAVEDLGVTARALRPRVTGRGAPAEREL